MRDTQRKAETQQGPGREPNVGLNPRTLGSRPELKADAQPLSQPGVPGALVFQRFILLKKSSQKARPVSPAALRL